MTANPHCKIGRIRPKSGGEVRLLPDTRSAEGEDLYKDLVGFVKSVKENFSPDEFAGFAIVTWDRDRNQSIYHNYVRGTPIVSTQIPAFVTECFRRRNAHEDANQAIDERLTDG